MDVLYLSTLSDSSFEYHDDKVKQIINQMSQPVQFELTSSTDLSSIFDEVAVIIANMSVEHDDFLSEYVKGFKSLKIDLESDDVDYDTVLSNYKYYESTMAPVDQNGKVEEGGSSSTGAGAASPSVGDYSSEGDFSPDIEGSNYDVGTPAPVPDSDKYQAYKLDAPSDSFTRQASVKSSTPGSYQARVSSPSTTSMKRNLTGAAGAAAGGIAGAAGSAVLDAADSIKSKIDNPSVLEHNDYLLGNYDCSNISDSLDDNQKKNVTEILKEQGCSDEEIEAVLNGEYTVSKVLVESVSDELEGLIETNPEVRQEIIDTYGIDVFNEDGTVNTDRLSISLCIDDLDGKDNYSLINMLSTNYGVNLVDQNKLSEYSKKMEELLLSDFGIKDKIKKEYGFDIFNADGSINTDRLTLLMLLDEKRTDGRSIDILIDSTNVSDIGYGLAHGIKSAGLNPSGADKTSIIKGVGLALSASSIATAAGMGVKNTLEKKKEELEETGDTNQIIDTNSDNFIDNNDNDDNKSWIYDVINE